MKPSARLTGWPARLLLSCCLALAASCSSATGVQVTLPKDEMPHAMPVEWWYYSGHLADGQGRRYGVMAGFFVVRAPGIPPCHFVIYQLVEKDGGKFHSGSVIEKEMIKVMKKVLAGLPEELTRKLPPDWKDVNAIEKYHRYMTSPAVVRNDQLSLKYGDELFEKTAGDGADWAEWKYRTAIVDPAFRFELEMKPERGPMFVGGEGNVGVKPGEDMFYYSISRLDTSGTITIGGEERKVKGTLWYDHQFGTFGRELRPIGWDWICLQLEDGTDLNLSAQRVPETDERFARLGTIMFADGSQKVVRDVVIEPLFRWTSADTGITYPLGWMIAIPSLEMHFTVKPVMQQQEMRTFGPLRAIWEGACTVDAVVGGKQLKGNGYTELVGYGTPK